MVPVELRHKVTQRESEDEEEEEEEEGDFPNNEMEEAYEGFED